MPAIRRHAGDRLTAMHTPHAIRPELPAEFSVMDLPLDLCFGSHPAILRWLQPGDLHRLIEFFVSHTDETIQQRYGFSFSHMTTERAAALVGVDQERDVALGVFEWWEEAWHLIGVGRYCLLDEGRSAELAFVVRENRRRLGIATTLLGALTHIARQCGLERLVAQVSRENPAMLAVFRGAGASFTPLADANTVQATLHLLEPAARTITRRGSTRSRRAAVVAPRSQRAARRDRTARRRRSRKPG